MSVLKHVCKTRNLASNMKMVFSNSLVAIRMMMLTMIILISSLASSSSIFSNATVTKDRINAPSVYRHNFNDNIRTSLSYSQKSGLQNSSLYVEWCWSPSLSSSSTVDKVISAEAEALAHILQLSVLDLVPHSSQPPSSALKPVPNSQRLFQALPSARELVRGDADQGREEMCLLVEVPLWESFACSAFIARAAELASGTRSAAAQMLLRELTKNENLTIDDLEDLHRVVLTDPSFTTALADSRDRMVRSFHDRRDELDRVAALAYYLMNKASSTSAGEFTFQLTSNGKFSNYSLTFAFSEQIEINEKPQHELEMRTFIEQNSELAAMMTVELTSSTPLMNQHQNQEDKMNEYEYHVLVRLPPHIAQLDARFLSEHQIQDEETGRLRNVLKFRHGSQRNVNIFPLSNSSTPSSSSSSFHIDRHWKAYWFVFTQREVSVDRRPRVALQIPLRIPRLPVEAYPPDLNRLVTLPSVIGARIEQRFIKNNRKKPLTESSIIRMIMRNPHKSINQKGEFTLILAKSANRVSLYQPGPDRAIPFVVLAFAMLVTSVLVIRTISVVAVSKQEEKS